MKRPFGRGITPVRGQQLTMASNHLLTRMILQVGYFLPALWIPRHPITLSEDDWGLQSPPQHGIRVPLSFSGGDWIPRGSEME